MKKISLWFLMIMLLVTVCYAGTLDSASQISVSSNNPEFGKYNLLVSWSSTPYVNDQLTITNSDLSGITDPTTGKPLGIVSTVAIDVSTPKFQQVFEADANVQKSLITAQSLPLHFWYFIGIVFDQASKDAACQAAVNDYIAKNNINRFPGVNYAMLAGGADCDVNLIVQKNTNGFYSQTVTSRGYAFQQTITVDKLGSITLANDGTFQTDLSVTKPGLMRATVSGFSSGTNSPLTDRDVFAYQSRANAGLTDNWNFFQSTHVLEYQQAIADLQAVLSPGSYSSYSQKVQTANEQVNKINNAVTAILSDKNTLPNSWNSNADLSKTSVVGTKIYVPLNPNVMIAKTNLLLNGEKAGIFIPVGVPKILSIDKTVTVNEAGESYVNFQVQNIGDTDGTFNFKAVCTNSNMYPDNSFTSNQKIVKGATYTGKLRLTGKSVTAGVNYGTSCTLRVTEANTIGFANPTYTEASFTANLVAKTQCMVGDTVGPYPAADGLNMAIDTVVDATGCKSTTQYCPIQGKQFSRVNGVWTCQASSETSGNGNGPSTFNYPVFIVTVILAIIGSVWMYSLTAELSFLRFVGLYKYAKIIRWTLIGIVFVAIILFVPIFVKGFLAFFSF